MKLRVLGIPVRITTLLALGAGFLAGSRAGRGPWEQLVAKASQYQGRHGTDTYNGNGTASSVQGDVDVRSATVPFGQI